MELNIFQIEKKAFRRRFINTSLILLCVLIVCLLTAMIAAGLVFSHYPNAVNDVSNYISELFSDMGISSEGGALSALDLFLNNLRACLTTAAIGFVPFVFWSISPIVLNGALVGVIGAWFIAMGNPPMSFVMGILPHGIFELPAIAMSGALGVCLCIELVRKITHSSKARRPFGKTVLQSLKYFGIIVVPCLAIAAIIEAYLTPILMMI